ncbi:DUF305 domain-containing protein [uncultured Mycobacterium sp.]|uniref:DUF305 domain-containing protein n=1 Tax=uncultured Mycobacterium sp. TaxID=171292 RepID=UPI0035CAEEC7
MSTRVARIAAVVGTLAAAAALSACRGSSTQQGAASGQADQRADHNRADITFAANMIPYHQQAVDLAAPVPSHTGDAELIKLGSGIGTAQQSEIQTLKGFLVQWSTQPDADTREPADMAMTGIVDQATMATLASLQGADYDKLWLQSIISHHQGAIDMANSEITNGRNSEAIATAKRMISTQQGEIDQMEKMLGG